MSRRTKLLLSLFVIVVTADLLLVLGALRGCASRGASSRTSALLGSGGGSVAGAR